MEFNKKEKKIVLVEDRREIRVRFRYKCHNEQMDFRHGQRGGGQTLLVSTPVTAMIELKFFFRIFTLFFGRKPTRMKTENRKCTLHRRLHREFKSVSFNIDGTGERDFKHLYYKSWETIRCRSWSAVGDATERSPYVRNNDEQKFVVKQQTNRRKGRGRVLKNRKKKQKNNLV